MPERNANAAGEDKGTGEIRLMTLPARSAATRRGLGRICRLLGLDAVRSDAEFLRLVEQGLPTSAVETLARNVKGAELPVTDLTEMVIPRRTFGHRRKGNQPLTRDELDKLVRVARVLALSEDVFADRAKAVAWLRRPKAGLGGKAPLAALATDTGARLVETMLIQLDHGMTAEPAGRRGGGVIVWRISNYASLDGTGGVRADGRWNTAGRPVVYCALHPATALVETFVHQEVDASGLPSHYRYLRIEIPDGTAAEEVGAALLPPGWEADEIYTRSVGDAWLAAGGTALLYVPSVIVPEAQNVLLNPRHRDAAAFRIVEEIAFRLDRRLLKALPPPATRGGAP